MLKIWGRTNSINVQKVMWTVGELELAHERIDAGGAFGRLDTDEYGRMNPNRRIPVLQDGDVTIWESQAIVRYLAAVHGAGSLWDEDPARRSLADRWMEWAVGTIMPQLHPIFWTLKRTPEAERDMAAVERAAVAIQPLWRLLDEHLAHSSFVAGDRLTMGDIPLGCAWWRYANLDVDHPAVPNIDLWYQNLKRRDAYRRHVMIEVT
ncbi:MAG: glutathione S-transferase family protein [Geminicoccaceae bacterium]|nr:glutathione S-transferase family protein [Geminicoccaceae bacterium]